MDRGAIAIKVCCTPYIMESHSSINTRQRSLRGVGQNPRTHLKNGLEPNSLVRWGAWQITVQTPVFGLPLQLFEVHFGRPCFSQDGSVGCCLSIGDFLRTQGTVSSRLLPLNERVGFIAWYLSRRYFGHCRTRVGFGPAIGPSLKTVLCHAWQIIGQTPVFGLSLPSFRVHFGRPCLVSAVSLRRP